MSEELIRYYRYDGDIDGPRVYRDEKNSGTWIDGKFVSDKQMAIKGIDVITSEKGNVSFNNRAFTSTPYDYPSPFYNQFIAGRKQDVTEAIKNLTSTWKKFRISTQEATEAIVKLGIPTNQAAKALRKLGDEKDKMDPLTYKKEFYSTPEDNWTDDFQVFNIEPNEFAVADRRAGFIPTNTKEPYPDRHEENAMRNLGCRGRMGYKESFYDRWPTKKSRIGSVFAWVGKAIGNVCRYYTIRNY